MAVPEIVAESRRSTKDWLSLKFPKCSIKSVKKPSNSLKDSIAHIEETLNVVGIKKYLATHLTRAEPASLQSGSRVGRRDKKALSVWYGRAVTSALSLHRLQKRWGYQSCLMRCVHSPKPRWQSRTMISMMFFKTLQLLGICLLSSPNKISASLLAMSSALFSLRFVSSEIEHFLSEQYLVPLGRPWTFGSKCDASIGKDQPVLCGSWTSEEYKRVPWISD